MIKDPGLSDEQILTSEDSSQVREHAAMALDSLQSIRHLIENSASQYTNDTTLLTMVSGGQTGVDRGVLICCPNGTGLLL